MIKRANTPHPIFLFKAILRQKIHRAIHNKQMRINCSEMQPSLKINGKMNEAIAPGKRAMIAN
jgi:hypothetical protein